MIQVYIHLEPKTNLFKNLKKRGFLVDNDLLFIWMKDKPCIGELISINPYSINSIFNESFQTFLLNRNKEIVLRISDLCQKIYYRSEEKVFHLKCFVDDSVNWY